MNVVPMRYLLVALLVVTAGCLGPGGTSQPETATERATQPAPETPAESANETADGESRSGTSIARQHAATLRERGSVTVRSSTTRTTTEGGTSQTLQQNRTSRFSFGDGRYLDSLNPFGGDPSVSYRTGNGTVVSRLGSDGDYSYVGPTSARAVNVTNRIRVPKVTDGALERRGEMTVDGVSGTVYVVEEYSAVRGIYEGVRASDVTAFNMTYVVADGHVSYLRLDVTITIEGETITQTTTARYTEVGTTTVERPAWVDRALMGTDTAGN